MLAQAVPESIRFFEVAPENWIDRGGALARQFARLAEARPVVCHGLSLSLGGFTPLDRLLLARIRQFLDAHGVALYTEHLSYCADDGQLYDLLPIPFTEAAVRHVAARIRETQDVLGRRIAIENASYYTPCPIAEMDELTFIRAVLIEADCDLHLDVNNVYVNSVNHGYDPEAFIAALPGERIVYLHVAGHHREADDLIVDTHGAAVIDPVWALLDFTYRTHGVRPTLLERDFNFPPFEVLLDEVAHIAALQSRHTRQHARRRAG